MFKVDEELLQQRLSEEERVWRDGQLSLVDIEINKLEDLLKDSSHWRAYRVALRSWPDSKNFPSSQFRPLAPDAKTKIQEAVDA